jgi:hypothetical protein
MGILMSVPGTINYSGTRGNGPVLEAGHHLVHIAQVIITTDGISNPFGDPSDPSNIKVRNYHDEYPCIAVRYSNPHGAITDRYYLCGFEKFENLTEAQKASGDFKPDPDTGYALTRLLDKNGQIVKVPTGEKNADGTPKMTTAKMRVISKENTEKAQRILTDLMATCKVPAQSDMTIDELIQYAFDGISKCVNQLDITVKAEEYTSPAGETKITYKVKGVREVGTSVPAVEPAAAATPSKVNDDF